MSFAWKTLKYKKCNVKTERKTKKKKIKMFEEKKIHLTNIFFFFAFWKNEIKRMRARELYSPEVSATLDKSEKKMVILLSPILDATSCTWKHLEKDVWGNLGRGLLDELKVNLSKPIFKISVHLWKLAQTFNNFHLICIYIYI